MVRFSYQKGKQPGYNTSIVDYLGVSMKMFIILLGVLLLTGCAIRVVAIVETEEAINGSIQFTKEQSDEQDISPQPVLP